MMDTKQTFQLIEAWANSFITPNPGPQVGYNFNVKPTRPPVDQTAGVGAPGSNYPGFVTTLNTGSRVMVVPVGVSRESVLKNKVTAAVAIMFQANSIGAVYDLAFDFADQVTAAMASLGQFCLEDENGRRCVSLAMDGPIKFSKPETASTERHKSEANSVKLMVAMMVCATPTVR